MAVSMAILKHLFLLCILYVLINIFGLDLPSSRETLQCASVVGYATDASVS